MSKHIQNIMYRYEYYDYLVSEFEGNEELENNFKVNLLEKLTKLINYQGSNFITDNEMCLIYIARIIKDVAIETVSDFQIKHEVENE